MKPSLIHCWPLMGALLATLPADAQSLEHDGARKKAPAPCYRAYCGDPGTLSERPAAGALTAAPSPANWQRSDARDWNEHMNTGVDEEDFSCLLSVGFGGELRAHGYQGLKLLGQTRTLNRPQQKAPK